MFTLLFIIFKPKPKQVMRPSKIVLMFAGLLAFTVMALPQTWAKEATTNTCLIPDQEAPFQNHSMQPINDFVIVPHVCVIVDIEVAFLPGSAAPSLDQSEVILDVPSPVPLKEGIASIEKLCNEKTNRMKNSK